jgi:hypothetical protein
MRPELVGITAIAVVAIVVMGWAVLLNRRTARLRSRFGPEYDREAQAAGPRRAEATLLMREKKVKKLRIRELVPAERVQLAIEWRALQSRFVDDPRGAVRDADKLIDRVMTLRGYPDSDFENRSAAISVGYPEVANNYRTAHVITLHRRHSQVTTEDLRDAMIHYRLLFDELLRPSSIGHHREVA